MKDIGSRLEGMSAEKRRLLEKLLREKGLALPGEGGDPVAARPCREVVDPTADMPDADTIVGPDGKRWTRKFYDSFHDRCDGEVFGEHSFFMNLGYADTASSPESPVELPKWMPNRQSARLALEVVGDAAIAGRQVLDIGCGRGGTIHLLHEYLSPARTVGLDLSPNGVAFCRRTHRYANTAFVCGDAENLPFADGSFDVVTNVESSHSYPNRTDFYREVGRVLRAGGHFLYGDVFSPESFRVAGEVLHTVGLRVERERDVTDNVLRSCEAIADSRHALLTEQPAAGLMADFLSTPASKTYRAMADGQLSFRITRWWKAG